MSTWNNIKRVKAPEGHVEKFVFTKGERGSRIRVVPLSSL